MIKKIFFMSPNEHDYLITKKDFVILHINTYFQFRSLK